MIYQLPLSHRLTISFHLTHKVLTQTYGKPDPNFGTVMNYVTIVTTTHNTREIDKLQAMYLIS